MLCSNHAAVVHVSLISAMHFICASFFTTLPYQAKYRCLTNTCAAIFLVVFDCRVCSMIVKHCLIECYTVRFRARLVDCSGWSISMLDESGASTVHFVLSSLAVHFIPTFLVVLVHLLNRVGGASLFCYFYLVFARWCQYIGTACRSYPSSKHCSQRISGDPTQPQHSTPNKPP